MGVIVWYTAQLADRFVTAGGTLVDTVKLLALIILGGLVYLVGLMALGQDDVKSLAGKFRRVPARVR
jgi:hypothetical protein